MIKEVITEVTEIINKSKNKYRLAAKIQGTSNEEQCKALNVAVARIEAAFRD